MSLTASEYQRYSRHIILPDVGLEGQLALKKARVLVVGAGGLGVPILLYLSAAGVGCLGIVDYDKIEFSNLQRQVIYRTEDVGKSKAKKAKEFIIQQNPLVEVHTHELWIDSSNALEIARDYDIIVDGTDNFPTRYLLNDTAILLNKLYVYGSIFRFEGQVSVFNFNEGPNYRDLFPEPPSPELVPNCSEGGVLGVLPGIVGSLQALEVIKLITGIGEVLSGRLLTIDTLSNQYRTFKFGKRAGLEPITKLIDYQQFCNASAKAIDLKSIDPETLHQWKRKDKNFQLIDVREPFEHEISHLEGELYPKSTIENHITKIRRDIPVVVYCRSGKRSGEVIQKLQNEHNFDNLINLSGGLLAYAKEVDPTLITY